jgi:hypothetical protein
MKTISSETTSDPDASVPSRIPLVIAIGTLLIHLGVNAGGGYGYFRDELYYIACTNRPDIGYVDQPPLSIWILSVNRWLLGDSIFALRLLPVIAGSLTVFLTGTIVRKLGGGKGAQLLACLAVALAPVRVGMESYYSMNSFDILFWTMASLLIVQMLSSESPREWLLLGLVLGLGMLNKISMSWLAFGLYAGILATPNRRWFRTAGPWLTVAIAGVIFAPFIVWNITHDFAHLEFAGRAAQMKYASQNPLTFVTGLLLILNPFSLPIWVVGLWTLVRESRWRVLGIAILTVLTILLINFHTKSEYFTPAFPVLCAAGAVWWERILSSPSWKAVRIGYPVFLVLSGFLILPLALPVLPLGTFIRYQTTLGIAPSSTESQRLEGLPQFYADRFGWKELVDSVAVVYRRLTPAEQKDCVVLCTNYGQAAAIEFFGKELGLPPAMSQHNSYFYWGLKEWKNRGVVIALRRTAEDLRQSFEQVEEAGVTFAPYAIPHENGRKIWICRKLKVPFEPAWRAGKDFI